MPQKMLIIFTLCSLFFLGTSGLLYVLMALDLRRKGRATKFLSLSFDPRGRFGIVRQVFRNYRQLKQDENKVALLPRLFWTSLGLSVLFIVLTFASLAMQ